MTAGCFAPAANIPVMCNHTVTYHVLEPAHRAGRHNVIAVLDDQPDRGPITHDAKGRPMVRVTPEKQ